jgi:L-cysteate sulfo-lyase
MRRAAERLRASGRRPYEIPIGASVPLGALGFVHAMLELLDQMPPPDAIVHATSSGGTQAGLVAACRLLRLPTRVVGISADEPSADLQSQVRTIVAGIGELVGVDLDPQTRTPDIEVDDRFVGGGYGVPTEASREATRLVARTEAMFLDPTYTAKAMAGLIAYVRQQRFTAGQTVVFWHTGGQVGLFA